MLTTSQSREQAIATAQVSEFMRKRRLSLADLIEIGGKAPKPKARHVEKCWSLIAHLGLTYAVLMSAGLEGDDQ
jgi:hypothetical protein